jgi:hypothetical protein
MRQSFSFNATKEEEQRRELVFSALDAVFSFLFMGVLLLVELLLGLGFFLSTSLGALLLAECGRILVVAIYGSIFAPLLGLTVERQEDMLKVASATLVRHVKRSLQRVRD